MDRLSSRMSDDVIEECDGLLPISRYRERKRREACKLLLMLGFVAFLVFVAAVIAVPCVGVLLLMNSPNKPVQQPTTVNCDSHCKLSIVESIPENLTYLNNPVHHLSIYEAWKRFLQVAQYNITISSSYWTLTPTTNITDITAKQGSDIFNKIKQAAERGVKIRVVQIPTSRTYPNTDTKELAKMDGIDVRSLNVTKLLGTGIMHTKMWIIDSTHFYVGSANMDWRSLTQVKEVGIVGSNCSCLANDAQKIFDIYWELADRNSIPKNWSEKLAASFNLNNPAQLAVNGTPSHVFFGSSPPGFNPPNRTNDVTGLLNVINTAKHFIYIAVMDYMPAYIYTSPHKYWSKIDDALRAAAYERGIEVKVLGSYWGHTPREMIQFMSSLDSLIKVGDLNGSIETKMFVVPEVKDKNIPFSRVNHNKYMVTDNAAYIGTSNWSGDYFESTAGVSCVVFNTTNEGGRHNNSTTVYTQLKDIFERDWKSQYSKNITLFPLVK